jgi:acyl dehydratase
VLAALGGTALEAGLRRLGLSRPASGMASAPGPEVTAEVAPPPAALVRDYLRFVGGDPAAYKGRVPAHLFPHWAFPLAAQTLRGLPYPLLRVMNGGCRLQMNAPLPQGQPLRVRARLESVADDGRRVVLQQRVITGTASVPEAVVADIFAVIKLGPSEGPNPPALWLRRAKPASANAVRLADPAKQNGSHGNGAAAKPRKEAARVPAAARELAFWKLRPDTGLGFALLTGDFNPVHWVRPYARAMGHRSTILHGFATLARAVEGLNRGLFAGDVDRLASVDVRFTRPLVLPARVGLYIDGRHLTVGDAPGGPAYLSGSFAAVGGVDGHFEEEGTRE